MTAVVTPTPYKGINLVSSVVTTNGSATITLPSNLLQNDVVYVCGASSFAETINAQNGFITIFANDGTIKPQSFIFRKVMGAVPDTTCNFGANGANCCWLSFAYRGARVYSPEGSITVTNATSGLPNPALVSFESADTRVAIVGFLDNDDSTATAPAGYNAASTAQRGMVTNSCTIMWADRNIAFNGTEDPSGIYWEWIRRL
jgi:hypothetical protein